MKKKLFNSKKGLGVGEVFIYIVAALTFAVIMIFGYKIINDFIHRGEDIQFLQFKNDLESSVKKIYSDYGSSRKETFHLPGGFDEVCFVDFNSLYNEKLCAYDLVACSIWKDNEKAKEGNADLNAGYDAAGENVFLKPAAAQQIKIFKFEVIPGKEGEEGFLCVPVVRGSFTIILEGKGDKTQLSLLKIN